MSAMSLSSPCMSDKTLLLSVEDLISIAMGPTDGNAVDFKMVQTILHILARQMRLLEQKVVVVAGDLPTLIPAKKDGRRRSSQSRESGSFLDEEDRQRSRQTSLEFRMEHDKGHRGTRGSRSESGVRRDRDGGKGGRDRDDDWDRSRRGIRSVDDGEESGGRRRQRGGREDDYTDGHGGRGRSGGRGSDQDDERGGRDERERSRGGRDRADDDGKVTGGGGKSRGRREDGDDERDDRGRSRGKGADDDEKKGGAGELRGRPADKRGGRGRSGKRDVEDYDDEEEGGRGRSQGGRQDGEDGRSGRSRSGKQGADKDDDEEGSRGKSRGGRQVEEDGRGGHDRSGKRGVDKDDDEEEGGRGRSRGGRQDEEDGQSGHGRSGKRGMDKDDDEEDGRGRSRGGRQDEEDGQSGHGRSGKRGVDKDDDEELGRGRSRGGRQDEEDGQSGHGRSGKRGVDQDDDEEGSRGRSHRGRRDDEDGTDGRSVGRGRDEYSEESLGRGHHRDQRRGAGGRPREGDRDYDAEGTGRDSDKRNREESDRASDGKGRGGRGERRGSKEGIGIREVDGPGKDKLLVVVKSPTSIAADRDGKDSIAVVTQSQFQWLQDAVDELREMAGPLPPLTMPDNKRLRQDLAAGASLTDTMQAMQVEARVKAAEEAVGRLGGLLTQLAASGALPADAARAALAGGWGKTTDGLLHDTGTTPVPQKESNTQPFITEYEMEKLLKDMKEDLTKQMQAQINKAATGAETAESTAKVVGGKVEELLTVISRVSEMHTMIEDYAQQLNGFDAGLNTQMQSFKEQLSTMRADLRSGMAQLEAANNNAETAAVMELYERYEELVHGLEDTLLHHTALTNTQHQLTLELKKLVESVEMLREEKADRDELIDGLRDKADMSRLQGLVQQVEFEAARDDLEGRIDKCHDKFLRQDEVWHEAVKDLTEQASTKAQTVELAKIRDETTAQLRLIDEKIKRLELLLGQPKTAVLMRQLARGALCGACLAPAMMAPGDAPAPPLLPAARTSPSDQPCVPEIQGPGQPDFRTHHCHRWVGGSHTLLTAARAHAPPPPDLPDVTRKYTGHGDDGRLYWMESATEPCVECNQESTPAPPGTARSDAGAGDAAVDGPCVCDSSTRLQNE